MDLDALRDLLPYAAEEPVYWREPFKMELYKAMEESLRAVGSRVETLRWAMQLREPPPRPPSPSSSVGSFRPPPSSEEADARRAPSLSEAALRPLISSVHAEVQAMLLDVCICVCIYIYIYICIYTYIYT